jgi:hypothetical protein
MSEEYEVEPLPGLPEPLPSGERLLWQGAPRWTALAKHSFYIREIAVYFGALLAWYLISKLPSSQPVLTTLLTFGQLALASAAALGLIAFYALIISWTTMYSVTSRRVVIRAGIALPTVVNLPFRSVVSAGFKAHADRTGNIILGLAPKETVHFLVIWPNVRTWRGNKIEPMLRGLGDVHTAAQILSRALAVHASMVPQILPQPEPLVAIAPHRSEPAAA